MTNEEARKHFKELGLTYKNITELDIRVLKNMLEHELIEYIKNGGDHARQMDMKISLGNKKDISFKDGVLDYAFIRIDGSYFKRREGISFNRDGFIGFAGEFSESNIAPILRAFCKWCYTVH